MATNYERFVEMCGIVDIRWISDDPNFYAEPEDLFEKENEGLLDWWALCILIDNKVLVADRLLIRVE